MIFGVEETLLRKYRRPIPGSITVTSGEAEISLPTFRSHLNLVLIFLFHLCISLTTGNNQYSRAIWYRTRVLTNQHGSFQPQRNGLIRKTEVFQKLMKQKAETKVFISES
jgi:hypothetical protein